VVVRDDEVDAVVEAHLSEFKNKLQVKSI
jgi:hypothetical protein